MYEHRKQRPLGRAQFFRRTSASVWERSAVALSIGVAGYHYIAGLNGSTRYSTPR